VRLLLAAVAITTAIAAAQSRPEFEVASIKLNVDGTPYVFNGMKSLGVFASVNQTLRNLIQEAYGTPSGRRNWLPVHAVGAGMPILGGPDWIGSDRYDITAKWHARPGDGQTMQSIGKAQAEMELMLRSLLESRFQVQVHRETRELPVYELTVATPGKLKKASCTVFDPASELPPDPSARYCGASTEGRKGLDWTLEGSSMKMPELAGALSLFAGDRPVIDKTGFTETFDVHLQWTPELNQIGARDVPGSPDSSTGSIFTVIQDQLGLRLKPGRGTVEVLVVDHAERPSPN